MSAHLHITLSRTVLMLATLALLSLPFAHRAGAAPLTPQMAQFLAMGGSIADICGDAAGFATGGCESCRISDEAGLPIIAQVAAHIYGHRTILRVPNSAATFVPTHDASPPVRAPPLG